MWIQKIIRAGAKLTERKIKTYKRRKLVHHRNPVRDVLRFTQLMSRCSREDNRDSQVISVECVPPELESRFK
jgi:hypothetical protein